MLRKKSFKVTKKNMIFFGVLLLLGMPLFYFVRTGRAATNITDSYSLSALPSAINFQQNGAAGCSGNKYNFCLNGNIYLEIGQSGAGSSLDAPETWSKSYIDPNRLNSANIGVYDGQYSKSVGQPSIDSNGSRSSFSDNGEAVFEFFTARDFLLPAGGYDESPCFVSGQFKPFLSVSSKDMTKESWKSFKIDNYLVNRDPSCTTINAGGGLVTKKTGKIVIFMRIRWITNPGEGRINAFKVATAYTDASTPSGNTGLTGYYSQFTSATNPGADVNSGQYAVQNRLGNTSDQGHYYFSFAPDCHIAPGVEVTRFIKWKDVDYPDFYEVNGKKLPDPRFRLLDVTNGGQAIVKDTEGRDLDLSGSQLGGNGLPGERKAVFKGGHLYEWHWYNITANDGIAFWMPFDDYPSLAQGCGSYNQSIGLYGGTGESVSQTDFTASGGDTLNFLVDEANTGGTAAAPDTTTRALQTSAAGSPYGGTFANPNGAENISEKGFAQDRSQVVWKLPGLGPNVPYTTRRWLQYSYKIKNDAQNGAKHCFTADMTPGKSNTSPGTLTSNTICVTIDNSLRPYLSTSGADVHAGDCVINTPGNGKIIGPPTNGLKLGSSGSYIVSAGDAINGFGSGGDPGGGNLTFGNGGFYGKICRPTRANLESDLAKDGAEVKTLGDEDFNLSSLEAGKRYIIKFAGDGKVHGLSKASVTITAGGTLTVTGNAAVGGDRGFLASRAKLPVVGMIAKNIEIVPSVTELNAVLYAEDTINTCNAEIWVNQCKSLLTVRGFAMAGKFSFRRVSAAITGLQKGEQIDFDAAFYLNPPPGMSLPGNAVKYLGEQAPRY